MALYRAVGFAMRLLLMMYPWLELLSLIQLGIEAGALFAVAWVFGMFILGSVLLRHVGMTAVTRLREAQRSGVIQHALFVDDLALVLAGLLFMIPGLLSDFFALVVMVGPLRRALAAGLFGKPNEGTLRAFSDRVANPRSPSEFTGRSGGCLPPTILEGDYQDVTDESENKDS